MINYSAVIKNKKIIYLFFLILLAGSICFGAMFVKCWFTKDENDAKLNTPYLEDKTLTSQLTINKTSPASINKQKSQNFSGINKKSANSLKPAKGEPVIEIKPLQLNFTLEKTTAEFEISNSGTADLTILELSTKDRSPWLLRAFRAANKCSYHNQSLFLRRFLQHLRKEWFRSNRHHLHQCKHTNILLWKVVRS